MHFNYDDVCCYQPLARKLSDKEILADAQRVLYKQAQDRHSARVRELEQALDAELAQIDKALGL